jgi:hypothetical protein
MIALLRLLTVLIVAGIFTGFRQVNEGKLRLLYTAPAERPAVPTPTPRYANITPTPAPEIAVDFRGLYLSNADGSGARLIYGEAHVSEAAANPITGEIVALTHPADSNGDLVIDARDNAVIVLLRPDENGLYSVIVRSSTFTPPEGYTKILWSPDGSALGLMAGPEPFTGLGLFTPAVSASAIRWLVKPGEDAAVIDYAWTKESRIVAVASMDNDADGTPENFEVAAFSAPNSLPAAITSEEQDITGVDVSANRVIYARAENVRRIERAYIADPEWAESEPVSLLDPGDLTVDYPFINHLAISPDGNFIVLIRQRQDSPENIVLLYDVSLTRRYTLYEDVYVTSPPRWSPEGRFLMLVGHFDDTNGDGQLYTDDVPGLYWMNIEEPETRPLRITQAKTPVTFGAWYPPQP